ncbi:Alpha-amylase [Ceraceosorus bombacis]|uniref:Alpha-amylase n=1 Tax=Ceraceosorus bombacis TaxID=401625 RepID=A0A0N7LAT5_9BASI|nr:Alpha-amylase [Ceraceosorus bombacis]
MSKLRYPLSNADLANLQSSYSKPAWWKEAVVYQIWPASFLNGNAQDGVGDLGGVISKLDYLKDLGADVVWLSPCYESPDKDYGYDVADYKKIADRYGSNQQLEQLIAELKKRGMKLMMDLIVNHTSSEHAWFKESLKGKDSSKRDWYIWRKGKVGANGEKLPPNNWVAFFTGPAWTYDEASDEWYLCIFSPWQPDLNWENPAVREAVHDVAKFWLDKGVAGFRMDVINEISKTYNADGSLPDAPITEPHSKYQPAVSLFCDGPRVHEFIQELGEKVLSKYDTITVGETPHAKHPDILLPWTHPARHELRSCFTFDLHDQDGDQQWPLIPKKIHLPHFAGIVNKWQTYCHRTSAWLANYFENHDQARTVSRWASDSAEHRKTAARMISLFQTSLSGSLYVYQGQEIGMKNIPHDWPIEEYKDVATAASG